MLPKYRVLSLTWLGSLHLVEYLDEPLNIFFAELNGEFLLKCEHFPIIFHLFLCRGAPDYEGLEEAEDGPAQPDVTICDLCQDLMTDTVAVRSAALAAHDVLLVFALPLYACSSHRFDILQFLWWLTRR